MKIKAVFHARNSKAYFTANERVSYEVNSLNRALRRTYLHPP